MYYICILMFNVYDEKFNDVILEVWYYSKDMIVVV